ncbi:MAG: ECF transporter S component [Christensenellales bacterium]|jgi:uncharacterized membrane protein
MSQVTHHQKVQLLVQFSMLLAIEALMCFVPWLGSIPLGPITATLAMIPVVITGILLGPGLGSLMGLFAGFFSFIIWTFMTPNPAMAFCFTPFYSLGPAQGNGWSLVICFVPRILVGTVAGLCFQLFNKLLAKAKARSVISSFIGGFLGSMVNTVGVVLGMYFFFGWAYISILETTEALVFGALWAAIGPAGLAEAIIAGIASMAVCPPIRRFVLKKA